MELFVSTNIQLGENFLPPEESHHITKVLRISPGEQLYLTDGKGTLAKGQLAQVHHRHAIVYVAEVTHQPQYKPHLHLYVSPTRTTERSEWIVEKSTELAVCTINFVICERTVRKNINLKRYQKIAISAAKQSFNCNFPKIQIVQNLKQALEDAKGEKLFAVCSGNNRFQPKSWLKNLDEYSLFIGPEGDFTPNEVDTALSRGCKLVDLGAMRLRTETAAIAGISYLRLAESGKKGDF